MRCRDVPAPAVRAGWTRPPRIPRAWGERDATTGQLVAVGTGLRPKSLMGLPWRYALSCIDELGLILRRDVIWEKPNQLPEAVTDRCRGSHEYWFHFVREPRYFADLTAVREPYASGAHAHAAGGAGSGTTAVAARALGRIGISADLSFDYARLARWRVFDSDGVDRLRASRCVPELAWQGASHLVAGEDEGPERCEEGQC